MKRSKAKQHNHSHAQNRFGVIPTPVRLEANAQFTGRGVTIAFLDSGFYPHPDLTEPANRIIAFKDISERRASLRANSAPKAWDWHGTQTSVAACGNGFLSDGIYRGVASDAQVVLVKVGAEGRITEEQIARGLEWVIKNKERYDIRVVNISLGGDEEISFKESIVDQVAEEAVRQGVVVVAAAGNSGCTDRHETKPPANSPSVITVGGYDDKNQLGSEELGLYCSSFGPTAEGIIKPEIIAPAIWVAAPILPRTDLYDKAEALSQLASEPDYVLGSFALPTQALPQSFNSDTRDVWKTAGLPRSLSQEKPEVIRAMIEAMIKQHKIVAAHYQHVDGTSFAAPIVSSVVAQMLEANPNLSPAVIKHILISTANRITGAPLMWQGYGVLKAYRAVEMAIDAESALEEDYYLPPRIEANRLVFFYHNRMAKTVSLAADFNEWDPDRTPFVKDHKGVWRAEVEAPPPGRYSYKFVINRERWIDDPSNGLKEPDNYGGLNSVLNIA